jgi:diamine N-acetyltransferase
MFSLRHANSADAAALAELAARTFRDAFARFNTAADMEVHCRTSYSAALQAAEIAATDRRTLLVEREGQLAGYAQLRMQATPDCVIATRPREVQRFYVDQRWHGQGAASILIKGVIEQARRDEGDVIWLGVWERNPRAIAFYRKHGFRSVGTQVFQLGSDPQRDLVMARDLNGGTADV